MIRRAKAKSFEQRWARPGPMPRMNSTGVAEPTLHIVRREAGRAADSGGESMPYILTAARNKFSPGFAQAGGPRRRKDANPGYRG